MNTRVLLIVTALIEAGAGAALLFVPSWAAELLLGKALTTPESVVVARVAAIALMSIAVACWMPRNAERHVQRGPVAGIMIYNLGVPSLLVQGWFASALDGWALWPASILHALLAVWCVACLCPFIANLSGGDSAQDSIQVRP